MREAIGDARMSDLLWGSRLAPRIGNVRQPHLCAVMTLVANARADDGFKSAGDTRAVFEDWWKINAEAATGEACRMTRRSSRQQMNVMWEKWKWDRGMFTLPIMSWRARRAECPAGLEGETPTVQLAGKIMREASQYHAGAAVPMAGIIMGLALNRVKKTGERSLLRLMELGYVTRTLTGKPGWKSRAGQPSEYVWNATACRPVPPSAAPYKRLSGEA